MKKKSNQKKGFSTVEIIITMFILVIIGSALINFIISIFSLNKITNENLIAQESIRRIFKIMSSEIRSMSPSSLGAYALEQTSTSSLIFFSNIDNDPLTERIRYYLDGQTLKKGITYPTGNPLTYNPANEVLTELAQNIRNGTSSIFSYYDSTYDGNSPPLDQITDSSQIRLIKINIIIDKEPLLPPGPLFMTTQVSIRNLKDNL